MSYLPVPRITPWVGRIVATNAVVLLLLETVFVSPALQARLAFRPDAIAAQPWSFFTYMWVHGGLLHLLANSIGLYVFGGAVERRFGGRGFLLFYLYCGVGAAIFCWLLSLAISIPPFVGASGAVLGLAVAFALYWPDARLMIFPIPIPISAKTLVMGLVLLDISFAVLAVNDGIAHLAHVGGAIAGYLYFRLQGTRAPVPSFEQRSEPRVVRVPRRPREAAASRRSSKPPARQRPMPEPDRSAEELDRLLDKISAEGISSLTPTERRFLDEVARRKQHDRN